MHTLEALMKDVNGSTFIGIDTETLVTLKGGKKNPYQGRVTKKVTGSNVMVFQNKTTNGYENMVKRRLEVEGKKPDSFDLSPRAWGTRRNGEPFVDHKGETYLEVIFLKAGEVQYNLDGKPCTQQDMIRLMKNGLETDKPEGKQGGLEDKVIIRTFKLESVKAVTINHTKHVL